jgi:hypothetical protein
MPPLRVSLRKALVYSSQDFCKVLSADQGVHNAFWIAGALCGLVEGGILVSRGLALEVRARSQEVSHNLEECARVEICSLITRAYTVAGACMGELPAASAAGS